MYASMAANASYSLTIDLDLPHVHIKRKSFIKSDKLDFTLGEWTYYNVPFGNFKNGFKSRMKLVDGKLVEEIVNLGNLSNHLFSSFFELRYLTSEKTTQKVQ